ncbi:MAG: phenylacetate-CoA oxygenase subunit PaaI [Candidatus Rokubacteria bacterium]|nr:phenylacetate-CoA oxygenase subunit PaaI [Candidatus Rokubacteria bacterium]
MSQVLDEIREAYRAVGIRVADPAAYGTYYTLRCAGCDRYLGVVGDRLLPGLAATLMEAQRDLYAQGLLGCQCGHQAVAAGGRPTHWQAAAPEKVGPADWPLWREPYAQGDPLPAFPPSEGAARYRFNEGDALPDEYRSLLLKMLAHEGERAGNKSFWGFMSTCADLAEALAPSDAAKGVKAEYLAEEMKHAILFHRLAAGLDPTFALKDVPYTHYAFHLPRESWADDAFFHFFVDLNGAFHSRDWRESSYVPLTKIAATVERDELGHSEMGYRFLIGICQDEHGKILAQHLLDKWYPAALDMFGRSYSANVPKFIRWGLKSVGNAEIRQAYKQYVDRKLEALGLRVPDEMRNRRFL